MRVCLVTGAGGLIGSESVRFFSEKGFHVVGIDNDMRRYFFGEGASTAWNVAKLGEEISEYEHINGDIRDQSAMGHIFEKYGTDIELIIHTAAQPSHDWAAREPLTDFSVNATGTLILLELTRKHCPKAVFILTSTNKVYGDLPNHLPLVELETRWELEESHPYHGYGIDEQMSLDQSTHSLFGVSKAAADLMVQEYGRYFGLRAACFRGCCLTGPAHSGAELHGFLAYLMKCAIERAPYTVFGYKGKQVRDNIHSYDLINMFWHFFQGSRIGEVYNAGGSRYSHCSMLEAIKLCEDITGNKINWAYSGDNRIGDHIWYVSDIRKFRTHYPEWEFRYSLTDICYDIYKGLTNRR